MTNFTNGGIQSNTDESAGSKEGAQVGGMEAEVERNETGASEARDAAAVDETPEAKRQPVGFYETSNELYELGFDGTQTYFICYDLRTGNWNRVVEIPVRKDLILVPLNDELITKRAVHLTVVPMPYGSEKALYELIRQFIHKYLGVSEFYERMASYYVFFTWVHQKFNTLPYLRALGDYGTGKSRFLQIIGSICYRPMFASGATTVSPIFRIIDRHHGTLIIDEADFSNSDADSDIVKILNGGYQKDFPVIRSEKIDSRFEPVPYDVYGPKLIATRRRYKDKALESRCLTEDMDFKHRPDIPPILPSTFWDEALMIRNMLLQWRFDKYPYVQLRPERINESIEARLNQVLIPLASIIDDQKMLDELRMFAERYNKNIIVERGMLIEAEVLQVILDLAVEGNFTPQMKGIADRFNSEREPKDHITPRKVGAIVGDKLKLSKKLDSKNTYCLCWDGEKIAMLCEKYGVVAGVGVSGHSDVSDILCGTIEKSGNETLNNTK
jgi:hypothetical protein